jgi:hypothetical protein
MRKASGQQMLQWGAVKPSRPVGIDLTEPDRERAHRPGSSVGGRLAEGEVRTVVALGSDRDRLAPERGEVSTQNSVTDRRHTFHLDRLSRELLVDEIIAINPTASVSFLSEFGEDGLRLYLGRLRSSQLGRGRASMCDRPAGPAVTCAHTRKF